MIHQKTYDSPIGYLCIVENGEGITSIDFVSKEEYLKVKSADTTETPLLLQAYKELSEYFLGVRKKFTLTLAPSGTPFQLKVWSALCEIPYGETKSYKQIAERAGNPKACRAVGMANNRNPIPIIIPCHRVIGTNGKLVGYGGGLDIKERLLQLEKNTLNHEEKQWKN